MVLGRTRAGPGRQQVCQGWWGGTAKRESTEAEAAARLPETKDPGVGGVPTGGADVIGNVTNDANGSLVPQFARPDGLAASNGTWSGTFADINEAQANDTTFIASPTGPTSSNFYEVTLSDVAIPGSLTGLALRYRYAKSGNNAGQTTNLIVELRQGSTVIASPRTTTFRALLGRAGNKEPSR